MDHLLQSVPWKVLRSAVSLFTAISIIVSSLVNTHASVPPLFSQALIRQRSKIPNQGMHVFRQASTRFYNPLLELWECQIKLASQACNPSTHQTQTEDSCMLNAILVYPVKSRASQAIY